jgi:hypothetical protein
MRLANWLAGAMLAGLTIVVPCAASGQAGALRTPAARTTSYIIYDAEAQSVKAGVRSVLEMRFRVADGFHVNSHTPRSEFLIPTRIEFQPAAGVKAETAVYPAGVSYSFSFDPANKLDVYTGDFTVKLPVVAAEGQHTIQGALTYQACDKAACYPPRSLPVQVIFSAK